MTGTANGLTVTGVTVYGFSAQQLFFTTPIVPPFFFTDTSGIGFTVTGGQAFNIYEDAGNFNPGTDYACGADYCLLGLGTPGTSGIGDPVVALTSFTISLATSETPLPAALPLFASGLGVLGFVAHRRKRKVVAAA
jgi:hypothetical protein